MATAALDEGDGLVQPPGTSGHRLGSQRGPADLEGGQEPLRRAKVHDRRQLAVAKEDVPDAVVAVHHLPLQGRQRPQEGRGSRQQLQPPVQAGHGPTVERVLLVPPLDRSEIAPEGGLLPTRVESEPFARGVPETRPAPQAGVQTTQRVAGLRRPPRRSRGRLHRGSRCARPAVPGDILS